MATLDVFVTRQGAHQPRSYAPVGVRVDLYDAGLLEAELGGAPTAESSPATAIAATAYTGNANQDGLARFTGLTAGPYWARTQLGSASQWQFVMTEIA